MKRKRAVAGILSAILAIIMTLSALASSTILYCDSSTCHTNRVFNRVNTSIILRHTSCDEHDDCTITRRYQLYDWRCSVCNYGGGAYGGEELLAQWHTPHLRHSEGASR